MVLFRRVVCLVETWDQKASGVSVLALYRIIVQCGCWGQHDLCDAMTSFNGALQLMCVCVFSVQCGLQYKCTVRRMPHLKTSDSFPASFLLA